MISIDFTNMMASAVENGVTDAEWEEARGAFGPIHKGVATLRGDGIAHRDHHGILPVDQIGGTAIGGRRDESSREIGRGFGSGTFAQASTASAENPTVSARLVARAVDRNAAARTNGVTEFLRGESFGRSSSRSI